MLEFRKDLFADERDDNLKEIGKGTQRQDMLGHVTATSKFFDDHQVPGLLHLKVLRSPHHHARIRSIDVAAAERAPGVRRVIRGADVPVNLNTLLSLLEFGKDDEPSLAVDKVRYRGEPIVAVVATSEREAYEAIATIQSRLRYLAGGFRRRRGAQAGRSGGERGLSEKYLRVSRQVRSSEDSLRRRGEGIRRGRPCARPALPDVADRACTDRDQRVDRGAGYQRPLYRLYRHAGAVLLPRYVGEDPRCSIQQAAFRRRHGRRRFRRQGRHPHRAARHPRRHADRPAGPLRPQSRGGDAVRPAARRRAPLHQGRRDEGRPHRRPQGDLLFRQRRLYAAVELCGGQMRGARAGPVYDPQRPRRHLLRLYQPNAFDRHAGLRRHRRRLRHRGADGQARAPHRHGPDGLPHPQRLSRRRHEGAPARRQELRPDRMRAGGGGQGEVAGPRGSQAHVLARRRRRHAGRDAADAVRRHANAGRAAAAAAHELRAAGHAAGRAAPALSEPTIGVPPTAAPPPRPAPTPAKTQHGAARFSSVFGTRRR